MARKFSQRIGLITPREAFQKNSIDSRLKNRLWSLCLSNWLDTGGYYLSDSRETRDLFQRIWDDFLGLSIDDLDDVIPRNTSRLKKWFFAARWNEIYDLVQFLGDLGDNTGNQAFDNHYRIVGESFIYQCNELLEAEKSAYRFVGFDLCEVTDETEIEEIEKALEIPGRYDGAREHLKTALRYFGDRDGVDYRNSIKESISSIESLFTAVNEKRSKNLPEALKLAESNGIVLHSALKKGISNIYGWTSDEAGIRHALSEKGANVTEAEARLMLVLCSSLVNYVISKQA